MEKNLVTMTSSFIQSSYINYVRTNAMSMDIKIFKSSLSIFNVRGNKNSQKYLCIFYSRALPVQQRLFEQVYCVSMKKCREVRVLLLSVH